MKCLLSSLNSRTRKINVMSTKLSDQVWRTQTPSSQRTPGILETPALLALSCLPGNNLNNIVTRLTTFKLSSSKKGLFLNVEFFSKDLKVHQ